MEETKPASIATPSAPSEDPALHLDPQTSSGLVPFGDIKLQLELGRWNVEKLNRLLARAQAEYSDPNARYSFLTEQFRGTPFGYEASLKIPPAGTLRVNLEALDCTGLVIYVLAMNNARNFEEFIQALRRIRYIDSESKGVDSDPLRGNILDFAEDIFLRHAPDQGFLVDVTAEVAGKTPLANFKTRVMPFRRTKDEDPDRRVVFPKLSPGRVLNLRMLSRKAFAHMDRTRIKSGDILLFSRIKPGAAAKKQLMFAHATVALNQDGEIYMVHASRDYLWRPHARQGDESLASGVYLNDPRREQLGVATATYTVKDRGGRRLRMHRLVYHGYLPDKIRPVYDYLAGTRIQGLAVLRPANLSPEARSRLLSYRTTH